MVRGAKREFISRCYNLLLRTALGARFSDAQCGFKAIRADRARELLPLVEDTGWFFDTELLVLAERSGCASTRCRSTGSTTPISRVAIVATALADLKGIARLSRALARGRLAAAGRDRSPVGTAGRAERRRRSPGQLVRFGLIGVASTLGLPRAVPARPRRHVGPGRQRPVAAVTAVANTAANRRLTFGVRGAAGRLRHQGQGLVVFALGLAVTSGSLFALHRGDPHAARAVELAVLVAANLVATLLRFVLFRIWLFPHRAAGPTRTEP